MTRNMITLLLALGVLLLAGCEEWSGASNARPRTQGEFESALSAEEPRQ